MAEAILKYDLSDEDDRKEHLRCINATNMACAIFEIQHNLHRKLERILEAEEASDKEFEVLKKVYAHINKELENNHINIDQLID